MEGRGISTQATSETQQIIGYKRSRQSGFGVYQDTMTERSILNVSWFYKLVSFFYISIANFSILQPGAHYERVIAPGTFRDASATNIDLRFKLNGLQMMSAARNIRSSSQLNYCCG